MNCIIYIFLAPHYFIDDNDENVKNDVSLKCTNTILNQLAHAVYMTVNLIESKDVSSSYFLEYTRLIDADLRGAMSVLSLYFNELIKIARNSAIKRADAKSQISIKDIWEVYAMGFDIKKARKDLLYFQDVVQELPFPKYVNDITNQSKDGETNAEKDQH